MFQQQSETGFAFLLHFYTPAFAAIRNKHILFRISKQFIYLRPVLQKYVIFIYSLCNVNMHVLYL